MKCSICNHPIEHFPTCPIISKPTSPAELKKIKSAEIKAGIENRINAGLSFGRPTHAELFTRDFGPMMAAKILAKPRKFRATVHA